MQLSFDEKIFTFKEEVDDDSEKNSFTHIAEHVITCFSSFLKGFLHRHECQAQRNIIKRMKHKRKPKTAFHSMGIQPSPFRMYAVLHQMEMCEITQVCANVLKTIVSDLSNSDGGDKEEDENVL